MKKQAAKKESSNQSFPLGIFKKFSKIRGDIGYMQKTGRGKHGTAITAADVFDRINKLLIENKLEIHPERISRELREKGAQNGTNLISIEIYRITWIDLENGETFSYKQGIDALCNGASTTQGATHTILKKMIYKDRFDIANNDDDPDVFNQNHNSIEELERIEFDNHQARYLELLENYGLTTKEVESGMEKFIPNLFTFREIEKSAKNKHRFEQKLKELAQAKKTKPTILVPVSKEPAEEPVKEEKSTIVGVTKQGKFIYADEEEVIRYTNKAEVVIEDAKSTASTPDDYSDLLN